MEMKMTAFMVIGAALVTLMLAALASGDHELTR